MSDQRFLNEMMCNGGKGLKLCALVDTLNQCDSFTTNWYPRLQLRLTSRTLVREINYLKKNSRTNWRRER